jgi:hypothetical protein
MSLINLPFTVLNPVLVTNPIALSDSPSGLDWIGFVPQKSVFFLIFSKSEAL